MQVPDLKRLFMYNHWANAEVARAFDKVSEPPRKSVAIFGHIAAAERLWLARIRKDGATIAIWPELSVDEALKLLGEAHVNWRRYLDGAGDSGLDAVVHYANAQGEPFTNTARDIVLQVLMHSSYHRAQIALNMRESGHTPPITDFIYAIRHKLIE